MMVTRAHSPKLLTKVSGDMQVTLNGVATSGATNCTLAPAESGYSAEGTYSVVYWAYRIKGK